MRRNAFVFRLTLIALFIAIGVIFSTVSIPIGTAKVFPIQHAINVILAILFGPLYAVIAAFITSTLRILLGTGSLLAYPGSMIGALMCGLFYKYSNSLAMAYIGELIGTGLLGALASFPIAVFLLGREAALFTFLIPFSISAIVGVLLSGVIITSLDKIGFLSQLKNKLEVL